MKIELPNSFVKRVNREMQKYGDWDGTESEYRDYIIYLICKDLGWE